MIIIYRVIYYTRYCCMITANLRSYYIDILLPFTNKNMRLIILYICPTSGPTTYGGLFLVFFGPGLKNGSGFSFSR